MRTFCLGGCGRVIQRGSHCPRCKPRNGSTRQLRVTRERVLERDGYVCQVPVRAGGRICGEYADHADHITPVDAGGSDHESNLRAACANCNLSRGADR